MIVRQKDFIPQQKNLKEKAGDCIRNLLAAGTTPKERANYAYQIRNGIQPILTQFKAI